MPVPYSKQVTQNENTEVIALVASIESFQGLVEAIVRLPEARVRWLWLTQSALEQVLQSAESLK